MPYGTKVKNTSFAIQTDSIDEQIWRWASDDNGSRSHGVGTNRWESVGGRSCTEDKENLSLMKHTASALGIDFTL